MTLTTVAILLAAALVITWVNWYFLFSRRTAVAAVPAGPGVQAITIRVEGGYTPNLIEVASGRPVRLTFDRQEDNPCSEEVVLPGFGIRRDLPAFAETVIEFTPAAPGDYEFSCGMGMLRGSITVK